MNNNKYYDYYLAVDIGASGGRHILGHMENGRLVLEEIYRFGNEMILNNGHLCWDLKKLFGKIKHGLKLCKKSGKIPLCMGIDTWGVDYVLLGRNDEILGNTYAYRDKRTENAVDGVFDIISKEALYLRTGIQHQVFNTIFQLMALKQQEPHIIGRAEKFLMLPDYFNFLLTGNKFSEYTNGTTSQMIDPDSKNWDFTLIKKMGYNSDIFIPVSLPGTEAGDFSEDIAAEIGFNCKVRLTASHDTASAVMAVPFSGESGLYINSGTWSLMGCELDKPCISAESMGANFTNEGGYDYKYRFLKNIMGLWMIQSIKKEIGGDISFDELCKAAAEEKIESFIDCNDGRFLAPKSMAGEISNYCREKGLKAPKTTSETASVIYRSLAKCYAETANEIENITGRQYDEIYIVGGGSNAEYLNRLTSEYANKKITAGPSEATAIGNILSQMIASGIFADLTEARKCVRAGQEQALYRN